MRRRRVMELGARDAAAGPGPALGQGGLEALQHTGEGSGAGGEGGGRRGRGAEPGPLPRPGGPLAVWPALTPGLSPSQWARCCPAMAGTCSWPWSPCISSCRRCPAAWRRG